MNKINQMYGHLLIDGMDAYDEYGFIILKGSMESWLLFPEMKEPFSHNWKDEDGLEVDLENSYVKEKSVSLKVLFIAGSEAEFWTNYKRTLSALTAPGIRKVYYREMDKEFEVYYTKSSTAKTHTRLKQTNKVVVEMSLHFNMPNPTLTVDRVVHPTGVSLSVSNPVYGIGSFVATVTPLTAPQSVKVTIVPESGNASITGRSIRAISPGSVQIRVEVPGYPSIYDEKNILVYPDNIIWFADGDSLTDGFDYITIN